MQPLIELVGGDVERARVVVLGAVVLAGVLLLLLSSALSRRTGMSSAADVVASDTGQNRVRLYRSPSMRLSGQPDYILRERSGWTRRRKLVPVEMKSWRSERLYPAQEIQLAAYLALMKEEHGRAVADYGYVVYGKRSFRVEWSRDLAGRLRGAMAGARAIKARGRHGGRTHDNPAQCRACPYRDRCDESLA